MVSRFAPLCSYERAIVTFCLLIVTSNLSNTLNLLWFNSYTASAFTSYQTARFLRHPCRFPAKALSPSTSSPRIPGFVSLHSSAVSKGELSDYGGSTVPLPHVNSSTSPSNANDSIPLILSEVDVLYGQRQVLVYDAALDRYVSSTQQQRMSLRMRARSALSVALIPRGVTPNYYRFIRWRILQRFVNANLHVFGTQSLLMGLGIKSLQSKRALSAALNWVLKDALGKITRMLWASKMGRRFDSDAKRWRFRSALVFAAGNGLEIVTYLFPQWFLVWATCANSLKQISMLTSSSTRTAIYNSFRDNKSQNIGDITAKGEAQIAIVDLLGIASGVSLSRAIGTSASRIVALYAILQLCEIWCMYQQLRAVQYRVLNFERLIQVTERFCDAMQDMDDDDLSYPNSPAFASVRIPAPSELAATERIFWPPRRLARRGNAFGSLSRAKLSPSELAELLRLFHRERFLLVVGPNLKRRHLAAAPPLAEQCHIVLHEEAGNVDIVKGTLALTMLRRSLEDAGSPSTDALLRTCDCLPLIERSYRQADRVFARFLRVLSKEGWESPARFMFGRVHMRADWPLAVVRPSGTGSAAATVSNPSSTGAINATAAGDAVVTSVPSNKTSL